MDRDAAPIIVAIKPTIIAEMNFTPVKSKVEKFVPISLIGSPPNRLPLFPNLEFKVVTPRQQLAAVATTGDAVVIDNQTTLPDLDQLLSRLPSLTRRQFLVMSLTLGFGAAAAWAMRQVGATVPSLPQPQPPSIESPPQNPVTSAAGAATAGEVKNPPAVVESVPRFDRAYTVVQPGKETISSIQSNFFPDYMLNPTALVETRLNTMTGEPIIRSSLRLVSSNDPNDRSLVDYIGDRFDDPSHGFMQNGKLQNYPPPKELPDGTKEYTLLDEKGPTVVDWMWFTNKNYQDHYAAMGNIRIYVDNNLAIQYTCKRFL